MQGMDLNQQDCLLQVKEKFWQWPRGKVLLVLWGLLYQALQRKQTQEGTLREVIKTKLLIFLCCNEWIVWTYILPWCAASKVLRDCPPSTSETNKENDILEVQQWEGQPQHNVSQKTSSSKDIVNKKQNEKTKVGCRNANNNPSLQEIWGSVSPSKCKCIYFHFCSCSV